MELLEGREENSVSRIGSQWLALQANQSLFLQKGKNIELVARPGQSGRPEQLSLIQLGGIVTLGPRGRDLEVITLEEIVDIVQDRLNYPALEKEKHE